MILHLIREFAQLKFNLSQQCNFFTGPCTFTDGLFLNLIIGSHFFGGAHQKSVQENEQEFNHKAHFFKHAYKKRKSKREKARNVI